jgi:hypothetical protein
MKHQGRIRLTTKTATLKENLMRAVSILVLETKKLKEFRNLDLLQTHFYHYTICPNKWKA